MSDYVIGIDPDSKKHGVAIYECGKLRALESWDLMQLFTWLTNMIDTSEPFTVFEFHIEDVCAQNFIYTKNKKANDKITQGVARSIGRCQQSQIELERMIAHVVGDEQITKHKVSKAWKDTNGKKQFQKATGWTGRSNEDTRSAAYFGYLGI